VKWQVCGVWLWCDIGTCYCQFCILCLGTSPIDAFGTLLWCDIGTFATVHFSLILMIQPILKLSFNYVIFGFFLIIFSILLLLLSFLYLVIKYYYYCYNL
jgi:hypothetical protein